MTPIPRASSLLPRPSLISGLFSSPASSLVPGPPIWIFSLQKKNQKKKKGKLELKLFKKSPTPYKAK
jgi:hypothetical protein